jgi:hypothetical protein
LRDGPLLQAGYLNMPAVWLLAVLSMARLLQAQAPAGPSVQALPEGPLPFSHRQHAAQGLDCSGCHEKQDTGREPVIPATATCMACHTETARDTAAIKMLAEYDRKGETIPWRRLYQIDGYLNFSHTTHVATGKIACDACHGPVQEMDVTRKVKDTSMGSCLDCHREKNAPQTCDTTCHGPLTTIVGRVSPSASVAGTG